jgi:hypothetical protein
VCSPAAAEAAPPPPPHSLPRPLDALAAAAAPPTSLIFYNASYAYALGAAAGYEGRLSETTSFRLQAIGYTAGFRSAGVVRDDDFRAGRIGFFDTSDARQGGEATRASVSGDLHYHLGGFTAHQQAALVFRSSRVRENFTGFLSDVQLPRQAPHGQRGDLIDRDSELITLQARGYGLCISRAFQFQKNGIHHPFPTDIIHAFLSVKLVVQMR